MHTEAHSLPGKVCTLAARDTMSWELCARSLVFRFDLSHAQDDAQCSRRRWAGNLSQESLFDGVASALSDTGTKGIAPVVRIAR